MAKNKLKNVSKKQMPDKHSCKEIIINVRKKKTFLNQPKRARKQLLLCKLFNKGCGFYKKNAQGD